MEKVMMSETCILVDGLPPDVPQDSLMTTLTIHFQSRRKSGGGDIEEDGVVITSDRKAVVRFAESESRGNVMVRRNQSIVLCGRNVDIQIEPCPFNLAGRYFPELLKQEEAFRIPMGDEASSSEDIYSSTVGQDVAESPSSIQTYSEGTRAGSSDGSTRPGSSLGFGRGVHGTHSSSSHSSGKRIGRGRGRARGLAAVTNPLPKPGSNYRSKTVVSLQQDKMTYYAQTTKSDQDESHDSALWTSLSKKEKGILETEQEKDVLSDTSSSSSSIERHVIQEEERLQGQDQHTDYDRLNTHHSTIFKQKRNTQDSQQHTRLSKNHSSQAKKKKVPTATLR